MFELIRAEHLQKDFDNQKKVIFDVSYSVEEQTFNVILGQSGSGKSTLLNMLSGISRPTKGKVLIENRDIYKDEKTLQLLRKTVVSNVFQEYMLLPDLNVCENIQLGENIRDNRFYNEIIELLGIEDLQKKFPAHLSGGQKQRVAIARAVIKKPKIIFCDEATGALDENNSKRVVSLLHDLKNRYKISIIFTTHNFKIGKTADKVTVLRDGKISEEYINSNPISPSQIDWGMGYE